MEEGREGYGSQWYRGHMLSALAVPVILESCLLLKLMSYLVAGMALARGNSMGIPGLKRAQSLAERRRQPSFAMTYGQQQQLNSPALYASEQRGSDRHDLEEV